MNNKGYVDKVLNKNTCNKYMMINKNTPRVTRTKKYSAKSEINEEKKIIRNFRMRAWRKETNLRPIVVMGKLEGEVLWLWSLLLVKSDIWHMKCDTE